MISINLFLRIFGNNNEGNFLFSKKRITFPFKVSFTIKFILSIWETPTILIFSKPFKLRSAWGTHPPTINFLPK